ncbi:hypothetical protein EDD11_000764 [Mortierella claussenii]|nr:hypothetical protein EDD11_000764 [Mortierella claussenii]
MHSYFDITKELTKTDCRTMTFYNDKFQNLKCGLVGKAETKCKKLQRSVVKLKDVVLNKKEVLVDTRSGRDEIGNKNYGYFNLGVGLTQCLGVRVLSDPDHIYVLQSDGNFVSYNIKTGNAVSSTQSQGRGTKGDYSIIFQTDGNLVIYDKNGVAAWSSASYFGSPDAFRLKVDEWQFQDGHMYLTDSAGRAVWGTFPALAHADVTIQQKNPDGGSSGYCVDSGRNSGGPTYLSHCDTNRDFQRWNIFSDGSICNKQTGLCLYDLHGENDKYVAVDVCNLNDKRYQWQLHGDGTIRNRNSNKCLNNWGQRLEAYNQIQVHDCVNAWSEKWWIGGIP